MVCSITMKTTTLFHTDMFSPDKPYYTSSSLFGGTRHDAYFLQSRESGEYNRQTHSKRPTKSTKDKTSKHEYFIPDTSARTMDVAAELNRGQAFFTKADGIPFGVRLALLKMGNIVTLPG